MYQRILAALDGSGHSLRAAQQAVDQVLLNPGAQLDFISVIAIDVYSDMVYDPAETHGEAQREIIQPAVDIALDAGVEPQTVILHGRPADEIMEYASQHDVDLIVIGSRGLNALQELALGSVSHKVIVSAACPVLVVK